MALFSSPLLWMALAATCLAAVAGGVVGSYVVVKRISFLAGSISHAVLGGMGLCLWLQRAHGIVWLDPLIGALASAVGAALLLGWAHLRYKQREDAVIAAIWSTGMAAGVVFLSLTPGTNVDLLNFLFGNILWVTPRDLLLLAALNGAILAATFYWYHPFLAVCFDEEQAALQGVNPRRIYMLLLSLVALTIVILMQVIGSLLSIALLTIPATIGSLWTRRLSATMGAAILLFALFGACGLELSLHLDWPPGATIALVAAGGYGVSLAARQTKFSLRTLFRPFQKTI
jgi:zinc transport system permease protein